MNIINVIIVVIATSIIIIIFIRIRLRKPPIIIFLAMISGNLHLFPNGSIFFSEILRRYFVATTARIANFRPFKLCGVFMRSKISFSFLCDFVYEFFAKNFHFKTAFSIASRHIVPIKL